MIIINKKTYNTSILQIINTLKSALYERGIKRFGQIKDGAENIQVSCPIHKEGQERRPSCGISKLKKGDYDAGTVHCFTCGYTATLPEMISNCFGFSDNGVMGNKWLNEIFDGQGMEYRKVEFNVERNELAEVFVEEKELQLYRYLHPYMFERKLNDELIEKFDIGFDKETNSITFPVRNKDGNCLFVARRRVDRKFFNYPQGAVKPLYGIYELPNNIKEVIICESFFDAITCYKYGRPAIALLGLGTKKQIEEIKKLNVRKLLLGFDGDVAGDMAALKLRDKLKNNFIIKKLVLPRNKDINDLDENEFNSLEIL